MIDGQQRKPRTHLCETYRQVQSPTEGAAGRVRCLSMLCGVSLLFGKGKPYIMFKYVLLRSPKRHHDRHWKALPSEDFLGRRREIRHVKY